MIRKIGPPLSEPLRLMEEITDPVELERGRVQHEQALANSAWLSAHWSDLLPQALGKFVAVAAQAAFIADPSDKAYELAIAAHPEEKGVSVQYVSPATGAWIYSVCRALAIPS